MQPSTLYAVHPRGCGDRATKSPIRSLTSGSSPRVRGSEQEVCSPLRYMRFIPAGAGIGGFFMPRGKQMAVHPRGCGDRIPKIGSSGFGSGSSPRVRGSDPRHRRNQLGARFIPAGAGIGDFPERMETQYGGSSPRVRGSGGRYCQLCRERRFIPAGAGIGFLRS